MNDTTATSPKPTDEREAFEAWIAAADPRRQKNRDESEYDYFWRKHAMCVGFLGARAQDTELLRETLEALKACVSLWEHTDVSYAVPYDMVRAAITELEKRLGQ